MNINAAPPAQQHQNPPAPVPEEAHPAEVQNAGQAGAPAEQPPSPDTQHPADLADPAVPANQAADANAVKPDHQPTN